MSTDGDKPFLCTFPGCTQRFTNNDHLLVHQQKHEFSLKFGAGKAGENLLVDQTPTPTRFLRNCEESGLFQELETNPFDQDFKQATNGTLKQQATAMAASFATPARLSKPHSEDPGMKDGPRVTIGSTSIPVAPPSSIVNPEKPVPMATPPPHISTATALTKQKLLENIQMRQQQKILEAQLTQQIIQSGQATPEILAQALKNVIPTTEVTTPPITSDDDTEEITDNVFATPTMIPEHSGKRRRGRKPEDEDPEVKRQRFLERNRAAASRCRAKKKVWVDCLEKKAKEIETMNQQFQQEVLMLRSEVQQLKSILIAHKDCPLIVHHTVQTGKTGEPGESDADSLQSAVSQAGVTLLSQLAHMPSMSPLIASPVPSVGSVVPNIGLAPSTIIITTTNGLSQHMPGVAKDVEIRAEPADPLPTEQ